MREAALRTADAATWAVTVAAPGCSKERFSCNLLDACDGVYITKMCVSSYQVCLLSYHFRFLVLFCTWCYLFCASRKVQVKVAVVLVVAAARGCNHF